MITDNIAISNEELEKYASGEWVYLSSSGTMTQKLAAELLQSRQRIADLQSRILPDEALGWAILACDLRIDDLLKSNHLISATMYKSTVDALRKARSVK
jgi:hypothetical protein